MVDIIRFLQVHRITDICGYVQIMKSLIFSYLSVYQRIEPLESSSVNIGKSRIFAAQLRNSANQSLL